MTELSLAAVLLDSVKSQSDTPSVVADLVPVEPGSIPITTSGKVRRGTCVERYRNDEFQRLDVT